MRTSLPASAGLSGSVHSSTLPLPLVSSTHGAQPWALAASPVSSHTLVLDETGDAAKAQGWARSEEHTSELQSRPHLVCRLLLEKKKKITQKQYTHATT